MAREGEWVEGEGVSRGPGTGALTTRKDLSSLGQPRCKLWTDRLYFFPRRLNVDLRRG